MKKTQTQFIAEYLKNHKEEGITSKQAYELFGTTRLASIIFNLRCEPYNMDIRTYGVNKMNRYGGISRVACYKLMD